MGVGERKIKRKSGKVTRTLNYTVFVDTGEKYAPENHPQRITKTLGTVTEVPKYVQNSM